MTRILLVDDDRQLRRALHITLRAAGYELGVAATGTEALARAASEPPDIVILDLGLPDLDGVAVLEGLRGWCAAPVIVLSARHEEQAKVRALDAGADDYVTKPFGMGELLARLRAANRRAAPHRRGHGGDHCGLHHRPCCPPGHRSRRRRPPHANRVATARDPGPRPGPAHHPATGPPAGLGAEPTKQKPTISAYTSPTCATNSSPTRPDPAT